MIIELRTYRCAVGDVDRVVARLRKAAFPILRDVGARTIGPWIAVGDEEPGVLYVLNWDTIESFAEGWRRFREDTRWLTASSSPIAIDVTSQVFDTDFALKLDPPPPAKDSKVHP